MYGYTQDKDAYLKRMRRIEGQVHGIAKMTCGHCVASVTEQIGEIDGVTSVAVDLPTGAVTVTSTTPVDDADVRAAVEEAGYRLAA